MSAEENLANAIRDYVLANVSLQHNRRREIAVVTGGYRTPGTPSIGSRALSFTKTLGGARGRFLHGLRSWLSDAAHRP